MNKWVYYNSNPLERRVGDCAIRACCKATGAHGMKSLTTLFRLHTVKRTFCQQIKYGENTWQTMAMCDMSRIILWTFTNSAATSHMVHTFWGLTGML